MRCAHGPIHINRAALVKRFCPKLRCTMWLTRRSYVVPLLCTAHSAGFEAGRGRTKTVAITIFSRPGLPSSWSSRCFSLWQVAMGQQAASPPCFVRIHGVGAGSPVAAPAERGISRCTWRQKFAEFACFLKVAAPRAPGGCSVPLSKHGDRAHLS